MVSAALTWLYGRFLFELKVYQSGSGTETGACPRHCDRGGFRQKLVSEGPKEHTGCLEVFIAGGGQHPRAGGQREGMELFKFRGFEEGPRIWGSGH